MTRSSQLWREDPAGDVRRTLLLGVLLAAYACGPGAAQADDMGAWCAQAKKPSSLVICSDPELRAGALERNKLFEIARAELSEGAYKSLLNDHWRWIKSYTAECGVAVDGPIPSLPIPPRVIDCYKRESSARNVYLSQRLLEPNRMISRPTTKALGIENNSPLPAQLAQPTAAPSRGCLDSQGNPLRAYLSDDELLQCFARGEFDKWLAEDGELLSELKKLTLGIKAPFTAEMINRAVKECVNQVHNLAANQGTMQMFFMHFDAYYNSATKSVQNNGWRNGDREPLYYFNKCMANLGIGLGEQH